MSIKVCKNCRNHPVTVNYNRNGKTYYRKICYYCIKKKKTEKEDFIQLLKRSGYKKKTICDRCGFKAKTTEQMEIYYKDNNKFNVMLNNLKSYCSNCIIEIRIDPTAANRDIIADY